MNDLGRVNYEHVVTGVREKFEEFARNEERINLMIAEKNEENDELKKSLEDLKKKTSFLIFQNNMQRQATNKTRIRMINLLKRHNAQNNLIKEMSEMLAQELEKVKLNYEQKLAALQSAQIR